MSGFEVVTAAGKGRCILATRHFRINDIIFEEEPLVSCQFAWNLTYKYLACDHCMKPLETAEENVRRLASDYTINLPFPEFDPTLATRGEFVLCSQCGVQYCSESCRLDAFNKYHATLCLGKDSSNVEHPLNVLNETWKPLHYPPETCSIMMIVRILAMIKQASNKDEIFAKFNDFQSSVAVVNQDMTIFHKLLGENFARDLEILFNLTKIVFPEEEFVSILNPDGFKTLFAMIGTNGQGIGTSSFSMWERATTKSFSDHASDEFNRLDGFINELYNKMDEVSGVFLNNEGAGLYSLQSKINHSCSPNAEITFPHSNYRLAVKALSDIKPGEEICISYLDDCSLSRSRYSRQKELKENYLFVCQCAMCQEQKNDPDVTSEEEDDIDDEDAEDMQE